MFCPQTPHPTTLGDMVKRSKLNFFRNIMLHIKLKGITNAATWSQIIYLQTPPDPGVDVKIPLFQNMVMLQIKLKGITNAATL